MKKTLLSVTAALAVIGSACAVPSVEDRKALCEKHPEKYVWVAKDEMCVPINPCLSDVYEIVKNYCLKAGFYGSFPFDKSKRDLVIERLVEKWWQTGIKSIKELSDSYFVVSTTDGFYFGGEISDKKEMSKFSAIVIAATAHNRKVDEFFDGYEVGGGRVLGQAKIDTYSLEECTDIKDFASLLFEDLIEGEYDEQTQICWITYD